jgi:hypothetical protein
MLAVLLLERGHSECNSAAHGRARGNYAPKSLTKTTSRPLVAEADRQAYGHCDAGAAAMVSARALGVVDLWAATQRDR